MSNTADEALVAFDADLTVAQNLIKFKQTFGYGFLNPEKFEESIMNLVVFDVSRNPNQVFIWIDRQLDILKHCGGSISLSLKRKIIMKGLSANSQSSIFSQNDFWFTCRGHLNMNNNLEYDDLKEYVWKYWDAHRPGVMAIDDSPFQVSKRVSHQPANANAVFNKRKPCEYCSKHRKDLSRTHGTARCFTGIILAMKD
jgi:hypothetical protein